MLMGRSNVRGWSGWEKKGHGLELVLVTAGDDDLVDLNEWEGKTSSVSLGLGC